MPKANPMQASLNGGEFSPLMFGRVDFDKYRNALRFCENFLLFQQGPAVRRSGTRFVRELSPSPTIEKPFYKLIPFFRSSFLNYMLLFQHGSFSVINTDEAYSVTGWLIEKGYWDDTGEWQDEMIWLDYPEPAKFLLPYTNEQLTELDWDQSSDALYLVHEKHAPRKITNPGDNIFHTEIVDILDGPYDHENTDLSITVSFDTAPVVDQTTVVTCTEPIFTSTDASPNELECRHFRFRGEESVDNRSRIIWGRIVAVNSPTEAVVLWKGGNFDNFSYPSETLHQWRLGLFSHTTGWPRKVAFHDERLVYGATSTRQDMVFFSKSQDYDVFSPTEYDITVLDNNAFNVKLPANKSNSITFMDTFGGVFAVGTLAAEWIISSTGGLLTPSNIQISRNSTVGSRMYSGSFQVNNSLFFLHRNGRALYELGYNEEIASYMPEDVNILAEHILRKDAALAEWIFFQSEPNPTVWVILTDGTLATMVYNRRQAIYGWSRQRLGGGGKVIDGAVIPNHNATEDVVYFVVERDGRYTVEVLEPTFRLDNNQKMKDMFFLDCGTTVTDTVPFNTVGNLQPYEGREVGLLGDGSDMGTTVVKNGQITLPYGVRTLQIGYPFVSELATLDIEAGGGAGVAQGKTGRIEAVGIRVFESLGFEYASNNSEYDMHQFRNFGDDMNAPPELFSGDVHVRLSHSYDRQKYIKIRQRQPYPLNVLALLPEMSTNQ